MSAIAKFKELKRDIYEAESWFEMIGEPYKGGGGGVGELKKLSLSAELYHQAYNGAQNYHVAPKPLMAYVIKSIKNKFSIFAKEAIDDMKKDLIKCGLDAVEEHKNLMAEAGIEYLEDVDK